MTHVLYYPDGNRRWAKKESKTFREAYVEGGKTLELLTEFFLVGGLADELTYIGSCEHTSKRDDGTMPDIYQAAQVTLEDLEERGYFCQNGIRFRFISHGKKVPKELRSVCLKLDGVSWESQDVRKDASWREYGERAQRRDAALNFGKIVSVLFDYSLVEDAGKAMLGDLGDPWGIGNYEYFKKHVCIPDIDLVLRPLELRASNGPVYAMGQAQWIELPVLNPELTKQHLQEAWDTYQKLLAYRKTTNPIHR